MKKPILIIIFSLLAICVIGLALAKPAGGKLNKGEIKEANNVYIENGNQIVEIGVRGGYYPEISTAKKGIPTIIRFKTKGTFDCSSAVRIPALNTSFILKNTETKDINVGVPSGDILNGSCSMGMYAFQIKFN